MDKDNSKFFKERLKGVKAFVFDVDGVLSKTTVPLDTAGDLVRSANAKDGYSLMYSVRKGYIVAIISGGGGVALEERFRKLGIKEVHLRIADKLTELKEFMANYSLKPEEVVYVGDDIPDYECMRLVGISVAPADACSEIKSVATYISDRKGGEGCARDIVEQTLRVQGKWMDTSCHVKSM